MADILLSVLIPSIIEREAKLGRLMEVLAKQADPRLEVLVYLDDRTVPLGEKRNDLMRRAEGKYLMHCDDDEMLAPDLFTALLPALQQDADLILFDADASLNGAPPFKVTTILGAANEQPRHLPDGRFSDIVRNAWFWNCWRTELVRDCKFPNHSGMEDWLWLKQVIPLVKTHRKVNRVLFHHIYNSESSTFDQKK